MDIQKLKREIFEEILEKLHEEAAPMNACAEKAKADETASKAVNEEAKAEAKPAEEAKAEAKPAEEQTAEEAKAEEPAKEEEKKAEEVIKIETLNSSPAKPTLAPQPEAWRNMSQKDFIQWIESGAYRKTI